jgi:hypothetical protein
LCAVGGCRSDVLAAVGAFGSFVGFEKAIPGRRMLEEQYFDLRGAYQ